MVSSSQTSSYGWGSHVAIDLDAIKARAAKATPGPWQQEAWRVSGHVPGCRPNGEILAECYIRAGAHTGHQLDIANAEFIAHARTDVPALVAEVDRLNALVLANDPDPDRVIEMRHEIKRLKAEVDELRATKPLPYIDLEYVRQRMRDEPGYFSEEAREEIEALIVEVERLRKIEAAAKCVTMEWDHGTSYATELERQLLEALNGSI